VKSYTRGGKFHESSEINHTEDQQVLVTEEEFPEVKVDFQAITVQLADVDFLHLGQILLVHQLMAQLGFGHMIRQLHHPEMLLYTVGLKSVHFHGNADLTDCCS